MGHATTTCCLVVPIYPAAIVISVLGVVAGGVFGVGYAVNIYNGTVLITGLGSGMAAIPYIGMVCWMSLAVISFFGLFACWKQHPKLVAIYFWFLLAHYIIDFGVFAANIFIAHSSARRTIDNCHELIRQSGMTGDTGDLCSANNTNVIIFLTILGVCKLIATYTTFVIFNYKRWCARQAEEAEEAAAKEAMRRQQDTYQPVDNGEPREWSKFED